MPSSNAAAAAAVTGSSLIFHAEDHSYWTAPGRNGGQRIPSVTQILKAVGVSEDFDAIEAMRPGVIGFRRDLGTAVHVDAHAFDDDDLDVATVDPRVRPYLEAWIHWRGNFGAVPLQRERRVYHPVYRYCGTLDGIFDVDGRRVLIDIKIGDPTDAGAQFQTAAYQAAFEAEHPGEGIDARWSIQLTPDCGIPYRVEPYTDWTDFRKFQAFLTTYWEQAARRRHAS